MSEEAVFIRVADRLRDQARRMAREESDPSRAAILNLIAQVMDRASRNLEEAFDKGPERN